MKILKLKHLVFGLVILSSTLLLSGCGKKTQTKVENKTITSAKILDLKPDEIPYISLIPSTDGHKLKLKIDNIPPSISEIEYELIYRAEDNGLEMEKGVGDTIKKISTKYLEREILLGTESCTNGCKYKYDTGITGGILSLTLISQNDGSITYESPFAFRNGTEIQQDGSLNIPSENVSLKVSNLANKEYFVLIKNTTGAYSVFSSGKGNGKVLSVTPSELIKPSSTSTIAGDYIIQ